MKLRTFLLLISFSIVKSVIWAQPTPFLFNFPFDSSVVDWGNRNFTIQSVNPNFGNDRFGGASRGLWLKNDSTFSSYVDISDSIKLNASAQLTYSLYFKPSTTSIANQMVLLDKGYDHGGWQIILTKTTANSGIIELRTLTNTYSLASSIAYGTWHHLYVQTEVVSGQVTINAQLNANGTTINGLLPISVNSGDTLRIGGSLSNSTLPFSGYVDHFRCAETQGFDITNYFFRGDVAVSIPTVTPCRNQNYVLTVDEVIGFYPNGNFQENTVHILDMNRNFIDRVLIDNRPFNFMIPDGISAGQHKITYAYEDPLFRQYIEVDSAFTIQLGPRTSNPAISVTGNTLTVQATGTTYNWQELDYLVYPTWYSIGVTTNAYTVPPSTMFNTNQFRCIVTTPNGCPMASQPKTHNYVVITPPIHSDTLLNPRNSSIATLGAALRTGDFASITTIYPNPTKDIVTLEGNSPILSYEIFSVEGKCVRKFQPSSTSTKETIDISQLSKGIYFIKIETLKSIQSTRLVVE